VKLTFSERAWNHYHYGQAEDPKLLGRINDLIKECLRDPFRGTGKPEPLAGNLSGWWSRRINGEHRLVYRVSGIRPLGAEPGARRRREDEAQALEIAQCRYHY